MIFMRLKSLYRHIPVIYCTRTLSTAKANSQVLTECFGVSDDDAYRYVLRYKLKDRDPDNMCDCIKFCRKVGYSDKEIIDTPQLLGANPLVLEQHYLVLQEGGFHKIKPNVLTRTRTLIHKKILLLKESNLIKPDTDVVQSFLSYIHPLPKKFEIKKDLNDSLAWSEVHYYLLQEYLRSRLDATEEDISRLFRIYKQILNKSFTTIQENFQIIIDLGYKPEHILKFGYLLHNFPKYPRKVLRDFPDLAGANMRAAMRKYPKLIMTSPRKFVKIYGILKEFGIPDETIRTQMNVFIHSPTTVRLRLEEIQKVPELRVLLTHPKVLKLLVNFNKTKSRLSFLQHLQLQCSSFLLLDREDEYFEKHIREGKDVNKLTDVIKFLKTMFHLKDSSDLEKHWKLHPFHLHVPLVTIEETFRLLKGMNFRDTAIMRVVHILLYPKEKIEESLEKMQTSHIPLRSLSQEQKLNIILYFIEKEHHFTGNGIWRKNDTDVLPEAALE